MICTLEYYLDPDSQDIYMRIPELSDKYFKTNLEEAADQQAANIENDLEELARNIYEDYRNFDDDEIIFLFIMLLSSRANTYKIIIEKLTDHLSGDNKSQISSLYDKKL